MTSKDDDTSDSKECIFLDEDTVKVTHSDASKNDEIEVKTKENDTKNDKTNEKTEEVKEKELNDEKKESNESKESKDKTDETKESKKDENEEDYEEDEEAKEKRLKKEREEEYKRKKVNIYLFIHFSLDIALIAMFAADRNDSSKNSIFSKDRILDFRYDTLDCSYSIPIRLFLAFIFVFLSITLGNPDFHEEVLDNDENDRKDKPYLYKLQTKFVEICMNLWSKFITSAKTPGDLLSGSNGLSNGIESEEDYKNKLLKTFNIDEVIRSSGTYDSFSLATFWKSICWLFLFSSNAIFDFYYGIKIVMFGRDSKSDLDKSTNYDMILFVLLIINSNLFISNLNKYIKFKTTPKNRDYDSKIHKCWIYLRKLKNNSCGLCWTKIKNEKGYRCDNCDFNLCIKCFKKRKSEKRKKDKELDNLMDSECSLKDKEISSKEYVFRLFKLHKDYLLQFIIGLVCYILMTLLNIFVPKLKGSIIDSIFYKNGDLFYYYVKIYVSFIILSALLKSISGFFTGRIKENIVNKIQQSIYQKIMTQDLVYFDASNTHTIASKLEWCLPSLLKPFHRILNLFISHGIGSIGGLIICWNISWRLTLLGFSTIGPLRHLGTLFRTFQNQNNYKMWNLQYKLNTFGRDGIYHIKTVRSFGKEPSMIKYYKSIRQEMNNIKMKSSIYNGVIGIIQSWFSVISSSLILLVGGNLILNGNYIKSVGLLITFERYWNKLQSGLTTLRYLLPEFNYSKRNCKDIFRLLDSKPKIENYTLDNTLPTINDIDGDITFENVTFKYFNKKDPVLKNVNLTIKKGKVTAFVGRSGGGKTTMVNLLMRLYDVNSGKICINGIDIRHYNPYSLRNCLAMVSQETELFSKTLLHNIGFSTDKYTRNEIEKNCKLANAHDFIQKFDEKYLHIAGNRGNRLSGGQKQRISIARMLMKRPKLMLLDEATSSLDAESEALVQAALEKAIEEKNCTVILIAHRLSTVINADSICVIDEGGVLEQGTHEELLKKNGIYAKLIDRQVNLRKRMRQKVNKLDPNNKNNQNIKESETDNIDKLIDSIKKEKEENEKKEKELKEKEKQNKKEKQNQMSEISNES